MKNKMFGSQKRKITSIMSFSLIFLVVGSVVAAVLLSNVFVQTINIYQASDQLQLSLQEQPLPGESIGGVQHTTVLKIEKIKDTISTFYWHVDITHESDPLVASDVSIEVELWWYWVQAIQYPYTEFLSTPPPTVFTAVAGVLTWAAEDDIGFIPDPSQPPILYPLNPQDLLYLELKLQFSTECPSGLYDVTVFVTDSP